MFPAYFIQICRLDALEADLEDWVMTFDKHGGMNRREHMRRVGCYLGQCAQTFSSTFGCYVDHFPGLY